MRWGNAAGDGERHDHVLANHRVQIEPHAVVQIEIQIIGDPILSRLVRGTVGARRKKDDPEVRCKCIVYHV